MTEFRRTAEQTAAAFVQVGFLVQIGLALVKRDIEVTSGNLRRDAVAYRKVWRKRALDEQVSGPAGIGADAEMRNSRAPARAGRESNLRIIAGVVPADRPAGSRASNRNAGIARIGCLAAGLVARVGRVGCVQRDIKHASG